MTKAGLSENPESTDELVRDIEESGYPVDGSTEEFVLKTDGLAVESDRPGLPPVHPDRTHKISAAPSENKSTSRSDVDEQDHAANVA
ncbi:MAG TPA: hypothetical protein VFF64_14195 [Candidatus Eremiobacteraceae bacterium]|nr:hypothetical protein [Candidatus Eremiobacteraceae bacterium]